MPFNASPRWPAAEHKYTPSRANRVFPAFVLVTARQIEAWCGFAHVQKMLRPDLWSMNSISSILKCSYIPQL